VSTRPSPSARCRSRCWATRSSRSRPSPRPSSPRWSRCTPRSPRHRRRHDLGAL